MEDKEYGGLYDFLENAGPKSYEVEKVDKKFLKEFLESVWINRVNPKKPPQDNRLFIQEGETGDGGWMFVATYNENVMGRSFLRFIINNGAKIDKIVYNDIEVKDSEKKRFLNEVLFADEEE